MYKTLTENIVIFYLQREILFQGQKFTIFFDFLLTTAHFISYTIKLNGFAYFLGNRAG